MTWKLSNPADGGASLRDASAAAVAPAVAVAPAGTAAPTYAYTTPIISSYALTAHAMAQIGFVDIVNVKVTGDVYFYVIDVAAFTSRVDVKTNADDKTSIITRYGIGFRVGVAAWDIDVSASANLGLVAASAQVKAGQTSISAHAFAGDVAALGSIAEIVQLSGSTFNAQTLKDLAHYVGQLAGVIASTGATIAPAAMEYGVLNPNVYSPDKIVASNTYAIEQLRRMHARSGLDNWLAGGGREDWGRAVLSPTVIAAAYANFGVSSYSSGGTSDTQAAANLVQALGT